MVEVSASRSEGDSRPVGEARRTVDRIASMVLAPSAMGRPTSIVIIIALLALSWLIPYASGGATHLGTQWFYVPILLAAARFGLVGALVTGLTAGVLAGPLLPSDIALGISQNTSPEVVKAVFFVLIGLLMAAIVGRLKTSLAQEMAILAAERDLVAREAAVISMVSHEFRTPLSVIAGSVETAKDRDLPSSERGELLDGASEATRKLETLVSGILAVAEKTATVSSARRLLLVELVISEVAEDLSHTWDHRIHWELAGGPVVWADPAVVKPALRAVLDNALKFSPSGSAVRVSALRRSSDVQITVTDAGPGIGAAFLPHAFEAFTQEDDSPTRERGGLGIGLFVAKTLIRSAGGEIELHPITDGGTEAHIRLPGARSDVESVQEEPEEPFAGEESLMVSALSRSSPQA